MKTIALSVIAFLLCATALAQSLGEFKPKDDSYGLKKLDKANANRIYIANFAVNFQVYNEKQKFRQGGYVMGGGYKGDAKTEVSVGLEGLDEETLQEITNNLYADYLAKLKAKGMTVIGVDEAARTETYEDWERVKGGAISFAQIPGTASASPTGYEWMVKGLDKKGKAKKGGFLGNENMIYPKLSKDLGDAVIAKVDITVLFVRDAQAFQGNGAKLKVKTDLRIASTDAITMTSDAVIKMKGQNSITHVQSQVAFFHGKQGMGSPTMYMGLLKDDLEINDVIEESKVTSYAAGSTDMIGTSTVYGKYFSTSDGKSSNAKIIPVDAAKYKAGVYAAAKKFLEFHTDAFLNSF